MEILHAQEADDLVEGAFGIELDLGMLVGDAQGPHRGLARMHGVAFKVDALAQGFRPQLAVPFRRGSQGVHVGHDHGDVDTLPHSHGVEQGVGIGGVLVQARTGAGLIHLGAARQQGVDIQSRGGGGQQAHRAEHGKAAAHAVGDGEGIPAVGVGQAFQDAAAFIGGDEQVLLIIRAQAAVEQLQHDDELGHGLHGVAGFGDDVEGGALQIHGVQQGVHAVRVHVVLHQYAAGALFFIHQLIVRAGAGGQQGLGAQGRTADAQYHQGVEAFSDLIAGGLDLVQHVFGLIRQVPPGLSRAFFPQGLIHAGQS